MNIKFDYKNKSYMYNSENNNFEEMIKSILINLINLNIPIPINLSDSSEWESLMMEYRSSIVEQSDLLNILFY